MSENFANLPAELASRRVRISLVGCGGNGSAMLLNLARLHHAVVLLGHPGFHVNVFDGDVVSDSNVGRQAFFEPDVGFPKASTSVNRINLCFGLDWVANDEDFPAENDLFFRRFSGTDILVVAVDSASSRRGVASLLDKLAPDEIPMVLDLGNSSNFGQVLIGGFDGIPSPYVQLPDLIRPEKEDPNLPSCSTEEALRRQELFVNSMAATLAAHLLWELFRQGRTNKAGFYFNLSTGKTRPVPPVRSPLASNESI